MSLTSLDFEGTTRCGGGDGRETNDAPASSGALAGAGNPSLCAPGPDVAIRPDPTPSSSDNSGNDDGDDLKASVAVTMEQVDALLQSRLRRRCTGIWRIENGFCNAVYFVASAPLLVGSPLEPAVTQASDSPPDSLSESRAIADTGAGGPAGSGCVGAQAGLDSDCADLVLRLTPPSPTWRHVKTSNETEVMRYVRAHTTVPVPAILDSCSDASTSLVGYEYILMERVQGVCLSSIWDSLDHEGRKPYLNLFVDVMAQLHGLKFDTLGSFTSHEGVFTRPPDIEPGPLDHGTPNVEDFFRAQLDCYISRMSSHANASVYADLIPRFEAYRDSVLPALLEGVATETETRDSHGPGTRLPFVLCHLDLAPKNVIVAAPEDGPPVFRAVLDWEWAGSYPAAFEVDAMTDFASTPEDMKYALVALESAGVPIPPGFDTMKSILQVVSLAMQLTSYQDWFIGKPAEDAESFVRQSLKDAEEFLPKIPVLA